MMVYRCVSKSTGEPIFGLSTNMTSVDMDLMTCDCARDAHMMKEMGCAMEVKWDGDTESSRRRYKEAFTKCMEREDAGYFSAGHLRSENNTTQQNNFLTRTSNFRCQPNGNYDEAQCVQQTYDDSYHPASEAEVCFCYQDGKEVTTDRQFSAILWFYCNSNTD